MRRRSKQYNVFFMLIAVIIFISTGFGFCLRHLEKPYKTALTEFASVTANSAVNSAIDNCLVDITYKELVKLDKNNNGEIVSLSTNTVRINRLKTEICDFIINYLDNYSENILSLKLGAANNRIIFSGFGPELKFKVHPNSIVAVNFKDKYTEAGINQVRHCIYLDVTINITVSTSVIKKTEKINNSILITDTVITGVVPDFYGFSKFGSK